MRKVLWIILAIVLVVFLAVFIWWLVDRSSTKKDQTSIRNINVAPLANDSENKLGTIIYSAAKKLSEVQTEGNNDVINLETTDSLDGAFNIYYQDVLNRYKTYSVNKKDISKSDALNKIAKVITVSGQTGKITITIWAKNNGMTQIEIVTSKDFK